MLDQFRKQTTANRLRADQLLDQLDRDQPDLGTALRQALEGDPAEFPTKRISEVMAAHGHTLSDTAIVSWRRRHRG